MEYIEYYYNHIQQHINYEGRIQSMFSPSLFVERWVKGNYKPVVNCVNFCKEIQFEGDKEELYMLCCYILTVVSEVYFMRLRPTAKEVNDELNKMDEVTSITFTDKEGKSITVKTSSIIKEVMDVVRADGSSTDYETDRLCKVADVSNNVYLQSMFAVELATFINEYFPMKRKKGSMVNTGEQELIMTILYLFELSPAKATNSRFRQLLMYHDAFKPNVIWSALPIDGATRLIPLSYIKWKQYNDSNWLDTEYERLKEEETVTFKSW